MSAAYVLFKLRRPEFLITTRLLALSFIFYEASASFVASLGASV